MSNKQLLQSAGDGTAVPAGYVGETKSAAATSVTASGVGATAVICSLSLEAGTWLLVATTDCSNDVRPTTGIVSGGVDLWNNTDSSSVIATPYAALWNASATIGDAQYFLGNISAVISVTSTKTIQYRVRCTNVFNGTGTPTCISRANGKFYAIRLA